MAFLHASYNAAQKLYNGVAALYKANQTLRETAKAVGVGGLLFGAAKLTAKLVDGPLEQIVDSAAPLIATAGGAVWSRNSPTGLVRTVGTLAYMFGVGASFPELMTGIAEPTSDPTTVMERAANFVDGKNVLFGGVAAVLYGLKLLKDSRTPPTRSRIRLVR